MHSTDANLLTSPHYRQQASEDATLAAEISVGHHTPSHRFGGISPIAHQISPPIGADIACVGSVNGGRAGCTNMRLHGSSWALCEDCLKHAEQHLIEAPCTPQALNVESSRIQAQLHLC